jgi:hypothetical protein
VGGREGAGAWGRNNPNNVCTNDYMNKEKNSLLINRYIIMLNIKYIML